MTTLIIGIVLGVLFLAEAFHEGYQRGVVWQQFQGNK